MKMRSLGVVLSFASIVAAGCSGGGGSSAAPSGSPTPVSSSSASPSATPNGSATATPSGSPSSNPTTAPTATPVSSPTAASSPAAASGTVVDQSTNVGLAGIAIAISPMGGNLPYANVATTDANGNFSFTATPGTYAIAVGSNSGSDLSRATEHDVVTLFSGGPNPLGAPIPSPVPNVTLQASQTSGNFRLAALTPIEQSCLQGVNTGRAAAHVPALIYDEESLELSRATLAEELGQNTDSPSPLLQTPQSFLIPTGFDVVTTGVGFSSCPSYSDTYTFTSSSVPYPVAIAAGIAWYAGNFGTASSTNYANEIFDFDPSTTTGANEFRRRNGAIRSRR
jgi:hypothetical protein